MTSTRTRFLGKVFESELWTFPVAYQFFYDRLTAWGTIKPEDKYNKMYYYCQHSPWVRRGHFLLLGDFIVCFVSWRAGILLSSFFWQFVQENSVKMHVFLAVGWKLDPVYRVLRVPSWAWPSVKKCFKFRPLELIIFKFPPDWSIHYACANKLLENVFTSAKKRVVYSVEDLLENKMQGYLRKSFVNSGALLCSHKWKARVTMDASAIHRSINRSNSRLQVNQPINPYLTIYSTNQAIN